MNCRPTLTIASFMATSIFLLPSQPTFAQDDGSARIEEIIVTARKREESLQDVPLAVTALDMAAIEGNHVSVITDIDKLVPNVDLADNPFAGQALGATIRGVGFSDLEKSFEPAVGFSIDGVFLASNTGGAIDAFDIEQVEVLRGPQGTLFGRNTVGGVINVRRSRPTGELGLKLGTRLSNHGGEEYLAVANAPELGDVLSVKAYAFSKKLDTFATNTVTGRKDPQTDLFSGGLALLFEPSDRFEALVSLDYFDDESQGPPTYNLSQPGELFCDIPLGLLAGGLVNPGNGVCADGSQEFAESTGFDEFTRGTPFITHIDGWSVTANIEYEISDTLTLTSVTGYRETNDQLLEENIGGVLETSPIGQAVFGVPNLELLYQNRVQEADQFSQEFRLSGEWGDNLEFVSGVFFLDSEYTLTGGEYPDGSFGNTQVLGAVSAITETAQQAQAFAIFVDGTYQISDRLSFSGGLRFSYEEKDFQNNYILSPAAGVTGQIVDISEDWDSPTGRAILQYELSDNAMVYGGYSRGFRSGGFNGRAASPASSGPYDQETLDSFEIGFRTEFFDNRLRFNPTVFYAKYDDKQEENLVQVEGAPPGTIETFVQNASEVDISGAELEVLAVLSDSLTFRGAFGYVDAEFVQFLGINLQDPTGPLIDISGTQNLRSGPEKTVSVGLNYSRLIMDGKFELILDAQYSYQDEVTTARSRDPLRLRRDIVGSINSADFSAMLRTQRDGANFTFSAFINDAFDDDAGRIASQILVPGTLTFGTGAPTKVYGFEAAVEF